MALRVIALSMLVVCLVGCAHSVVFINFGFGNKTAAGFGAPQITAETYCVALMDSRIRFKGKLTPAVTMEQWKFCDQVLQEKVNRDDKEKRR